MLDGRGKVHVQFLLPLSKDSTPPARVASSYVAELGGVNSRRPYLDGTLLDHPHPSDPGLLSLFYMNGMEFNRSARRSVQILMLLIERGTDQGYLPDLTNSIFISDSPEQEAAAKRKFAAKWLELKL